jgi:alkylhydroperoxidase family enzyme
MRDALKALRPEGTARPPLSPEGRSKARNALGTFAHHPVLAKAFHTFNGHILFTSTLSDRQRELLVLRVATVRDAEYEWAQHVLIAGDAGITREEIERIRSGGSAPGWTPLEAALLDAADELLADACIGDATWATLAAEFDHPQLLDVIFTVGAYELVAMVFKSCGVELDDDLRKPASP